MLGKYHLVLAHDIVANPDEWRNCRTLPPDSTVIIDNSIIELGAPVDVDTMVEAYGILGPDYQCIIVLPDKFDDPVVTLEQSADYLEKLKSRPELGGVEYMYVVQGDRLSDFSESFLWSSLDHIVDRGARWISVPRRVCDKFGTRMVGLYPLLNYRLRRPIIDIHLLGFSENVLDDAWCTACPGVTGIDSAVPVRLGQAGRSIDLLHKGDQAGPRGTFWEDPHGHLNLMVGENLLAVRVWFEAAHKNLPRYIPEIKEEWL
jgi:hypothetical protein